MRIADKMGYDQVNTGLNKNRSDLSQLQNEAATQKRVGKPSDDPLAATRVLQSRTEISGGKQYLKNIEQARAFLEYSEESLTELADVLVRAKELALSQSNDASSNKETRQATAAEVTQLFSQAVQVGNRKLGDRFLFGGFRTTKKPFDQNGDYKGDSGEIKISLNKDASIAMNLPGSHVFLGEKLHVPASAGPQKNGQGGGASAQPQPAQDELNTRTPSSIAPGVSGKKGASEEGGDAKENEGGEDFAVSDTWKTHGINIFHALKGLEIGLQSNDKDSIQQSLDSLDEAVSQAVLSRAEIGARVNTLNNTRDTLQKGQVDSKSLASSLEDADTFELVTDLNKSETTLKASLETSGKLIQPSLLDFIK